MSESHDLPADHGARLNEIIAGYLETVRGWQTPERQELLARHPDLAAELAAFFEDHDRFRRLADPLRPEGDQPTLHFAASAPAQPLTVRYFGDYELREEIARG